MATLTLSVSGMTCGHCKAKVAKALAQVDGVYAVEVDLTGGKAVVDLADPAGADRLVSAVQAAGYAAALQGTS
ncbi:MAG TPA: cation transporter [Gemmatimonadales bacterium]|jgi:copper chaperone CopZ